MADISKVPVPIPTPETIHFWEGTKNHQILLQKCDACENVYFPPRPFCALCASRDVSIFKASGRASLYSYIINHRPHPGFDSPYVIAAVKLEEGPVMMANILETAQTPEALSLDMPLMVKFKKLNDEITLPCFKPEGTAS